MSDYPDWMKERDGILGRPEPEIGRVAEPYRRIAELEDELAAERERADEAENTLSELEALADARCAEKDAIAAELAAEQMRANSLSTLNEGLRAEFAAERAQNEPWRAMQQQYETLLEELQAIGSEFGVMGGEKRTTGIRRVLTEARAEIAAERESAEQYKQSLTDLHKLHCEAVAHDTKLRELLERAQPFVRTQAWHEELAAAIDAVLAETKGDDSE